MVVRQKYIQRTVWVGVLKGDNNGKTVWNQIMERALKAELRSLNFKLGRHQRTCEQISDMISYT